MKLLIVEDEGLIANGLARLLQKSGYHICGISDSAEDALEKTDLLKPHFVFMEIHPDGTLDGVETAERVRTEFSLPVNCVTAHPDDEVPDKTKPAISAVESTSHKHHTERKVQPREAWFEAILRCAGDGVIITDADGNIEFLNDVSRRILGIHMDLTGETLADVLCLKNRITGAPVGNLVQLAILQGATISMGPDVIFVDARQHEADLEGEVALCEKDGLVLGTVITFRDVTLRNSREEQQQQNLENTACARLAAALSNDLRNLLRRCGDFSPEVHRGVDSNTVGSPEVIRTQQAGLISSIVNRLDTISHRDASFPRTLDLNALIAEVCAGLRRGLLFTTRLTSELEPLLHRIYADPVQITHVITSLITHSEDQMSDGGTIHIRTENCSFGRHSRTGQPTNYVRLTVHHIGPGIKTDEVHQPFQPFSLIDLMADKCDLRLFSVHGIITDARGSIRTHAAVSQGMGFEILLPEADKYVVATSSAVAGEPRREGATILFLHADSDVRALISDTLQCEGYEALEASDIDNAVETIAIYPGSIGVFIADLDLCRLSGPAIADWISARHPGIRIVLTVDHGVDPTVRNAWIERGARILEKPFRLDELLEVVSEVMIATRPHRVAVLPWPGANRLLGTRPRPSRGISAY